MWRADNELMENDNQQSQSQTDILQYDKLIQCLEYLRKVNENLSNMLRALNQNLHMPYIAGVINALLEKINEKLKINANHDIDKSIYFITSHLEAINFFTKFIKGRSNDSSINNDNTAPLLKSLINEGRSILILLSRSNIKNVELPVIDERATFSVTPDDENKERVMYEEQQLLNKDPNFLLFLLKIWVQTIREGLCSKKIFVSYAWPSENEKNIEPWAQQYIQTLVNFLIFSGLQVYLDTNNSGGGVVLSEFMKKNIYRADHCLLISTRTYGEKFKTANSGVWYEYNEILKRIDREPDLQNKRFIIPVLLNNQYHGPEKFSKIGEILFCYRGFMYGFKSLIKSLSGYGFTINNLFLNFMDSRTGVKHENQQISTHQLLISQTSSSLPIHMYNFCPRNTNFIGREDDLRNIEQYFYLLGAHNHATDNTRLCVLVGGGGIGKSMLAVEYAYRVHSRCKLVCYIPAETTQQIESAYAELAAELGIANKSNIVKEMLKWWQQNRECLVILDNAKNYDQVKDYIPSIGCHFLITTRSNEWRPDDIIKLNVFTPIDAKKYVVKILGNRPNDTEVKKQRLITEMGYFPLQLAIACAVIFQQRIDIESFLAQYKQNKRQFLESKLLPTGDKHESVFTTCNMAIAAVKKESVLADHLLKLCGYLHCNYIAGFLFELEGIEGFNFKQNDINSAIALLINYNLLEVIHIDEHDRLFRIHRVIQEVIRINVCDARQQDIYIDRIMKLFKHKYPYGQDTTSQQQYLRKKILLAHLEAMLHILDELPAIKEHEQDLLSFMHFANNYKKEKLNYVHYLNLSHQQLPKRPSANLTILPVNANITDQEECHDYQIKLEPSHGYGHSGSSIHSRHALFSPKLPENGYGIVCKRAENNFAIVRSASQKTYFAGYVSHRRDVPGHDAISESEHRLLECLSKVNLSRHDIKPLHDQQLVVMHILDDAYEVLGEVLKYKLLLERILFIRSQRYKQNSSKAELEIIAKALSNLARVNGKMCDYHEELALANQSLLLFQYIYDKNHPEIAICLLNISSPLYHLNRLEDLEKNLKRAFDILRLHTSYSSDHPIVLKIIMNLGAEFLRKGRSQTANKLIQHVVNTFEMRSGAGNVEHVKSLINIAAIHGEVGAYQLQHDLYERALSMLLHCCRDEDNLLIAKVYSLLGMSKIELNQYIEAKKSFLNAKTIYERLKHNGTADYAEVLGKLGLLYGLLNDHKNQIEIYKQTLNIYLTVYGPIHNDVAMTYFNIGQFHFTHKNFTEAKNNFLTVSKILMSVTSAELKVLDMLHKIAQMAIYFESPNWAIECFRKIIHFDQDNQLAYHNIACMYHVVRNYDLAVQNFNTAISIEPDNATICDYCLLLMDMKNWEFAISLLHCCLDNDYKNSDILYSRLDSKYHDIHIQREIDSNAKLNKMYAINALCFSYYLLIRCLHKKGDLQEMNYILNRFDSLVNQGSYICAYRLLSYLYIDLSENTKLAKCQEMITALESSAHVSAGQNVISRDVSANNSRKFN